MLSYHSTIDYLILQVFFLEALSSQQSIVEIESLASEKGCTSSIFKVLPFEVQLTKKAVLYLPLRYYQYPHVQQVATHRHQQRLPLSCHSDLLAQFAIAARHQQHLY